MKTSALSAHVVGHLSWNTPDGIPERIVETPQSSLLTDVAPPLRRADVLVRAGADGVAQVCASSGTGSVRVVQLASPGVAVEVPGDDALMSVDRAVTVLVHADVGGALAVRRLSREGATVWSVDDLAVSGAPRLFVAADDTAYVAGDAALFRLDDGGAECVAQWQPGGEPVLRPDGGVAFVRYDDARPGRNIVSIDPGTGRESVVEAAPDAFVFLAHLIGMDRAGRAYGFSGGVLGCVEPDGSVAWQIRPGGAAVAGNDVTMLLRSDSDGVRLLRGDGATVDITTEAREAILIGRSADGGYVLYTRESGSAYGSLLGVSPDGKVTSTEPVGKDVWVTGTDLRAPDVSSVTPSGEVLMGALGPEAVSVLALTA